MARISMKMDQVSSQAWLIFLIIGVVGLIGVVVAAALSSGQEQRVTADVYPDVPDSSEIDGVVLVEGMLELPTGGYAPDRGVIVLFAELPPATSANDAADDSGDAAGDVVIAKAEVETNGSYRLRVPSSDAVNQYASGADSVQLRLSADFDGAEFSHAFTLSTEEITGAEVNGSVVETVNLAAGSGD